MMAGYFFAPPHTATTSTTMRRQIFRFVCLRLFLLVTFCAVCGQAARSSNAVPLSASRIFRGGAVVADAAADGSANLGPLGIFVKTIQEARRHLAAAGVARCISIFAMYPMDTIKTRMQMEQSNPLRVAGLYKGVGGSLFGQVPYGILTFGSYEMYKNAMLENFPGTKPVFLYALAAIMGDLTGSGWLCPSEVVKQQMQAGMYATTGEAVSKIWAKKGLVGFYQGYLGGVTRDVPFRVAQLTSYEVTKNVYLRAKARRAAAAAPGDPKVVQELSPVDAAVCGAIAGSFSAAITSPLDRIKTLLMTDSAAYGGSVISCTQKIWQQEGIKGFAAGVVPRVTYIAPSVVIFFIAYEQTKQRLFPAPKED